MPKGGVLRFARVLRVIPSLPKNYYDWDDLFSSDENSVVSTLTNRRLYLAVLFPLVLSSFSHRVVSFLRTVPGLKGSLVGCEKRV